MARKNLEKKEDIIETTQTNDVLTLNTGRRIIHYLVWYGI